MILKIKNLSKQYQKHKALDNINLDIEGVKSLVLIGPSGSGKTTFLRVLAGLEVPEKGIISVNGNELKFDQKHLLEYRKKIGVVFQAFNLFPHLTAIENITLPLIKVHKYSQKKANNMALELLERFSLIDHKNKKPVQLSGGQQQRIALCRAASLKPEILFLDEPTSALDPEFTIEVLDLITELKAEGIEFVLVTHEMGFAQSVADHIMFLDEGKVLEQGLPANILHHKCQNQRVQQFMNKILKYEPGN